MKLVFLDVDGVLNYYNDANLDVKNKICSKYLSELPYAYMNKDLVSNFSNFVNNYTDIKIIISSSWRGCYPDLATLIMDFEEMGLPKDRIIDKTPGPGGFIGRGSEIRCWLDNNKFNGEFCIVDDCMVYPYIEDKLVLTDGDTGITDKDIEEIKKILKL